jgi:acetyl-CoA carboxylase biotin carboxyl carrier protein
MPFKKDRPSNSQPNRRVRRQVDEPVSSAREASVNMDELRELIALLRENGLAELELERDRFRVRLRREMTLSAAPPRIETISPELLLPASRPSAPADPGNAAVPAHPGAQAETAAQVDQDLQIIPSPIVGTFYRSPSPSADAFVKIGSIVEPETVVCIIEAMKLMNEIQAETEGEVVKIYVENGQPVEYGQPLFGIRR